MSLIDIILGQKIIVISIGVVVLLLLASIVLMIVPRIRRHRARIAAERAEQEALVAAAAEEAAAEKRARRQAAREARTAQKGAGQSAQSGEAAASTPGTTTPSAPAAPLISPDTGTKKDEEEVSPAMQDILSSVFGNEENAERQAALLRGYGEVDITDLLMLSQQVAAQMRGEKSVTVVESEEL